MLYYIGQAVGILATICCFIMPLFKQKWHMLICTAVANLFFALNLFLIGQVSSAIIINIVAVAQTFVSMLHVKRDTKVTPAENIIFLILYVVCGSLGFKSALDILPIVGAVFNMLATFQRDEQKTRVLVLLNASTFFGYYLAAGSTNMLAELLAIVTTVIAMIKYRKKAA